MWRGGESHRVGGGSEAGEGGGAADSSSGGDPSAPCLSVPQERGLETAGGSQCVHAFVDD